MAWEQGSEEQVAARDHLPGLQNDVLVQSFLSIGEAALQHMLVLLRQLLFHISLRPPQNKWLRHLKQSTTMTLH